jgi:hypothetical protein
MSVKQTNSEGMMETGTQDTTMIKMILHKTSVINLQNVLMCKSGHKDFNSNLYTIHQSPVTLQEPSPPSYVLFLSIRQRISDSLEMLHTEMKSDTLPLWQRVGGMLDPKVDSGDVRRKGQS